MGFLESTTLIFFFFKLYERLLYPAFAYFEHLLLSDFFELSMLFCHIANFMLLLWKFIKFDTVKPFFCCEWRMFYTRMFYHKVRSDCFSGTSWSSWDCSSSEFKNILEKHCDVVWRIRLVLRNPGSSVYYLTYFFFFFNQKPSKNEN